VAQLVEPAEYLTIAPTEFASPAIASYYVAC